MDSDLTYLINHLFLPPKLPEEDDSSTARTLALLRHITDSASAFQDTLCQQNVDVGILHRWHSLHNMLQSMEVLHQSVHIPLEDLRRSIDNMQMHGILTMYILKQNAGLIIRKDNPSHLTLEFFPASPTAAAVTSTIGKLVIQFPSRPRLSFPTDVSAIKSLCALLVDLDCTEMPDAAPVTQKAGSTQVEVREVADIRYISELLGGIARACTENTTEVAGKTAYVIKRINDHVLWKSCLVPWRRAPYWLIIRVVLQTSLKEWEVEPSFGYKVFITFVLARVLEQALNAHVAHHVLFTMNAKIAIRVSKFPATALSSPVFQYIARQTEACSVRLEQGWKGIQAAEALPLNWIAPTDEEINVAKGFLLTNSKAYLSEVYNRSKTLSQASNSFSPSSFEASLSSHTFIKGQSPPSPIPLNASGVDLWIGILDVEHWVACDMNNWLFTSSVKTVVEILRQMIARHDSLADSFSQSNPELFSRVFLTQMELWVALDKTVVKNIPLLADYSPELDVALFEPLLLPTLDQMIRLRAVENYIQDRDNCVKYPNLSVFKIANDWNSFPARYFNGDPALQSLRSEIQAKAERERTSTCDKWRTLNDKYINLMMSASKLDHNYIESLDRWGDPTSSHYSFSCTKCSLEWEAKNLSLEVHEWPLPEEDVLSRVVVFELRLPNTFGVWRDTTFSLARRYAYGFVKTKAMPAVVLHGYPALSIYFNENTTHQRLTIASTTQSFLVSHYRSKNFPCTKDEVIKNHGLRYDMLDIDESSWVTPSIFGSMSIRKQSTLSLAPGPYVQLAWSIVNTNHTSNMVIARQSQCPIVLSYHEWDAFGHLRAGNHLQWRNMMLELIRGTLTLGNSAVYLLFCQAAWQAEKVLSSEDNETDLEPYREAHLDLSEAEFGQEVLVVLQERFDKISGNWKEGWTAATLSMIACRLFSLNADEKVKKGVRDFLASLRETISGWIKQVLCLIKSEAAKLTSEEINELRDRAIQLAITCRSTYMLGDAIAEIFYDSNALTLFIDSAMVLQKIVPPNLSSLSTPLRYAAEKDIVLSAEVFDMLKAAVDSDNFGLDNAIRCTWQAFRRDTWVPWKPLAINDRWMTCQTSSEGNAQVCHVYFNLHNGTLLVDGKTIGGLPKAILGHPLFQSLFPNQSTADIFPSTMKGMDYQLSVNIQHNEVHFAMRGQELLIRTVQGSHNTSEFILSDKLRGDIPNNLLYRTHIMFHDSSQALEIYPMRSGWDPCASPSWRMQFNADPSSLEGQHPWLQIVDVNNSADAILCPHSHVVKRIQSVLMSLETSPTNLSISRTAKPYHPQNLQVQLPRYKLTFFVNANGNLECKDLPGFSVSTVQSVGTLCGLASKLVLETMHGPRTRKVIIPDGTEIFRSNDTSVPHPRITIIPSCDLGCHIRAFVYDVDNLIGRLVGDNTLTSWYLLAYLHIVTSYWLTDPLTCRTGVQQALHMLRSAHSFSFMELTNEHVGILTKIVNLAPLRQYYPDRLTSMETVAWHSVLSLVSQIAPYTPLVEAILSHGNKQGLFRAGSPKQALRIDAKGVIDLRERAEFRNARFVTSDLEDLGKKNADECYVPSRCLDISISKDAERHVMEAASLALQWPPGQINVVPDLWDHFKGWGSFSSCVDSHVCFDSPRTWLLEHPSRIWFMLFSLCRTFSRATDQYGMTFALGILGYRPDFNLKLSHLLLAVATHNSRMSFKPFPEQGFDLEPGHTLELQEIQRLAARHYIQFDTGSHQLHLTRQETETWQALHYRKQRAHESECNAQGQSLAEVLKLDWPSEVPQMPVNWSHYSLINFSQFKDECEILFSTRFGNYRLFQYATGLQAQLNTICGGTSHVHTSPQAPPTPPHFEPPRATYMPVTLRAVMESRDALPVDVSATRNLLSRLSVSSSRSFVTQYTDRLSRCVDALECKSHIMDTIRNSPPQSVIYVIHTALSPKSPSEKMIFEAGLWPSIGSGALLGQLALHLRKGLSNNWRSVLTSLAEALAAQQKALRLNMLERLGLDAEYRQEAANSGGQEWDILAYPDWLLIQLDANLLIRPVQASIAKEMMAPENRTNTVMQLNMGEGKSSVIVPIVSAALADGEQLVRVLVLKPLCAQMFNLLRQRICHLSDRRLFYLPFSRDVKLDVHKIQTIVDLFKECGRVGGVLVCQPEHILSFQLMGLDILCRDGDTDGGRLLLDAQNWFDQQSRDILDESDEILSVRYQLIYTIGTPTPLQGQPNRWQTVQEIFTLLRASLAGLATEFPKELELEMTGAHRFPRTRILSLECGRHLMQNMAHQIVFEGGMKSTPFRGYSHSLQAVALRFLTDIAVTKEESQALKVHSPDYFDQLLLLRGLIAHGILVHGLKEKRWRVDYGLDPSRSMLAVPFRAKDSPAPRAEFGHPDIIIVLTCLSYYYGGLTNDQLDTTFSRLFATDDPDLRYEDWIKGALDEIPDNLRNLRGLNLADARQRHEIFLRLQYNKAVVDFYLSECVFPKEAKEFKHKLTTNAWDLARKKSRLTTGFSGTNDHSYLLPLSIHQLDANMQRHTNAQVLEYLLRAENRDVIETGLDTAKNLIRRVAKAEKHVMVLLDVGAQILELQNEDVAREWLKQDTRSDVEAVIYCDLKDEFYVITRDGRSELLATSLYKTQLDKTLVYLDEAHTRGTDFKFPKGTRAVVTLGPKVTKDKLAQGCMRMRKLGSDHSILFFASREMSRKIQSVIGHNKEPLDSSDVLLWTLQETCTQISNDSLLWASQGENFDRRHTAWEKYKDGKLTQSEVADILREPESRTLEELYGVRDEEDLNGGAPLSKTQQIIRERCRQFDIQPGGSSALLEEQERELAHEKEEERQVQRTVGATPLDHSLDPALITLVQTGQYTSSLKLVSLLGCLQKTTQSSMLSTLSKHFFQSEKLVATKDFSDTIAGDHMDNFLRAVQWIITTTKRPNVLLLLSPFEANELLPKIRLSQHVSLHVYSPRTSRLVHSTIEDLDFFTVSRRREFTRPLPRVMHELNLFSGQLFFRNRESFEDVCDMLGLCLGKIPNSLRGKIDTGGFVQDEDARRIAGIRNCLFEKNPVAVLRELIGWRRKGHGFTLTHVGLILHGNNLGADEFSV